MIEAHLRDRFFQRYGVELDAENIGAIRTLLMHSKPTPDSVPGRLRSTVLWRGMAVRVVWVWRTSPRSRSASPFIVTFLPPFDSAMRIALPAKKPHKGPRR